MTELLGIVLPIFGLIGLGWLAGRLRILGPRTGDGLTEYVFALAVPALIVRTFTGADLPDANPAGFWLAYFGGVAVTWAVASFIALRFLHRTGREAALLGFTAGQSNTILVGVPLLLRVYGQEGAVPLFLLLAVHLPVMLAAATLLIEAAGASGGGMPLARKIGRTVATHPIVLGLALGVTLKLAGLPPTGVAKTVVDGLAASSSPCALVAMGLALYKHGGAGELGYATLFAALKLLLHPLAVYILAFHVLPVPPVWAGVAVLFAAMPVGVNAYLLAAHYGMAERTTSSAVAVSTVLAVVTVAGWLVVLGVG